MNEPDKTLSGLITDWGGFEDLVANLHQDGSDFTSSAVSSFPRRREEHTRLTSSSAHGRASTTS
jgi:hypothetical protein